LSWRVGRHAAGEALTGKVRRAPERIADADVAEAIDRGLAIQR
jgi:hypothetical protein